MHQCWRERHSSHHVWDEHGGWGHGGQSPGGPNGRWAWTVLASLRCDVMDQKGSDCFAAKADQHIGQSLACGCACAGCFSRCRKVAFEGGVCSTGQQAENLQQAGMDLDFVPWMACPLFPASLQHEVLAWLGEDDLFLPCSEGQHYDSRAKSRATLQPAPRTRRTNCPGWTSPFSSASCGSGWPWNCQRIVWSEKG